MDQRISKLDSAILSDRTLGPPLFDQLREAQRKLRLLHGDRPTCPFLRPYILSRQQYEQIKHAAEVIAHAFEKIAHEALRNPKLMELLCLTPLEAEMARIDPGYSRLCVNSRLDSYQTSEGFQFLEYNAETPAGVGDQMQLEKILFTLPAVKEFLSDNPHWLPQPHRNHLCFLCLFAAILSQGIGYCYALPSVSPAIGVFRSRAPVAAVRE